MFNRARSELEAPTVADQLDAFEQKVLSTPTSAIRGMVRSDSSWESQVAALRAKPRVTALQEQILGFIAMYGPRTALELEQIAEFRDAGSYNVRRRCSELTKSGRLVRCGTRNGAGLLDIRGHDVSHG